MAKGVVWVLVVAGMGLAIYSLANSAAMAEETGAVTTQPATTGPATQQSMNGIIEKVESTTKDGIIRLDSASPDRVHAQVLSLNVPDSILRQMEPDLGPDHRLAPISINILFTPGLAYPHDWDVYMGGLNGLTIMNTGWKSVACVDYVLKQDTQDQIFGSLHINSNSGNSYSIRYAVIVPHGVNEDLTQGTKYTAEVRWFPVVKRNYLLPHLDKMDLTNWREPR